MWWWGPDGMHGGWMGFWMTLWGIGGLVLLLLFVWLVARIAAGSPAAPLETPEQILKRRYARGEIDSEEYERRLTDVRK
jgi:putative membrane protein